MLAWQDAHVGFDAAVERRWIVHRGTEELDVDGTRVMPLDAFLRRLHAGVILG